MNEFESSSFGAHSHNNSCHDISYPSKSNKSLQRKKSEKIPSNLKDNLSKVDNKSDCAGVKRRRDFDDDSFIDINLEKLG